MSIEDKQVVMLVVVVLKFGVEELLTHVSYLLLVHHSWMNGLMAEWVGKRCFVGCQVGWMDGWMVALFGLLLCDVV